MRVQNLGVFHVFAVVLTISMTALSAHASFSNASLKGGYGVLVNRWTANSSDNESALLGVMTCDGAGNVSMPFTIMSGGVEQTGTATGTYKVNSNGTGTITFTSGFSNTVEFDIVINSTASGLAHGITLLRVDTNYPSDAVDAGTAVLQSTTSVTYNLGKAKGTFNLQLNGWTPDPAEGHSGVLGILTFDGAGNIKGSFTNKNSSGVVETGTLTGTYTVSSDGSGSMSLKTSAGDTTQISFVLNTVTSTGPAKGMQLLQTSGSGNKANTGVALKQ